MTTMLGEVGVAVRPNTSGFLTTLRREVDQAARVASKKADVPVAPDTGQFRRKLGRDVERETSRVRGFVSVSPDTKKFGAKLRTGVAGPLKALAPLVAGVIGFNIFKDAIQGASDLGEQTSKATVVFGKASKEVVAFADKAAKGMGQSKVQALEAAGVFGVLFRGMKIAQPEAAKMSTRLVGLAGDLASFNNANPSEVLDALRSGLVGETEPLRRYGVLLDDATLRQRAMKLGLITTTKDALSPQHKAMAAYQEVLAQTGLAQGDFARTSGSMANQQRILAAQFEDLKAKIGNALLPIATKLVTWFNQSLLPALERVGGKLGDFWKRIEPVRVAFGRLWDAVKEAAPQIGQALSSAFQALGSGAQGGQDSVAGFARFIRQTLIPAVKNFTHWVTAEGIPAFLDFADMFINKFVRPVGKAELWLLALITRVTADWVKIEVTAFGTILHAMAKTFGFLPVIGEKIRAADKDFAGFAKGAIQSTGATAASMDRLHKTGGAALDGLGRQVEGARGRYVKFQNTAKTPINVKVTANINDLAAKFDTGKIKAAQFRAEANAQIARITSAPAREHLNRLISDFARGKLSIEQFRAKWNAEMARLRDAKRIAGVVARLLSPEVLKSDLAKAKHLIGFASGGAVRGAGTGTSDSIRARLSAGEHVWTAREVSAAGGHGAVEAMRRSVMPGFAAGGPVFKVKSDGLAGLGARLQRQTGLVDQFMQGVGKAIAIKAQQAIAGTLPGIGKALSWAKAQVGKPYIWGGVGPRGYDCSGAMSALVNVLQGHPAYHRLFATGSFPVGGWSKGYAPGGMNIGSRRGNPGHMAGTLAGINIESSGGQGFHMGASARGARSSMFGGNIWHLNGRSGSNGGKEHLPGFGHGTAWVPRTGPAIVHQGERVFSRADNKALIEAVNGAGATYVFNTSIGAGNQVTAADVETAIRQQLGEVRKLMVSGVRR